MKKYLILGASAAGISAAQTIRRLDPVGGITIISQEYEWPYNKCFLADYASGHKDAASIAILTEDRAAKLNVKIELGVRVLSVDADKKLVQTTHSSYTFDALLIATGAGPWIPPMSGMQDAHNIFTFHTKHDIDNMLKLVKNDRKDICHATVIGAGLSGLECADALVAQGVRVTVVEQAQHVLPGTVHASTHDYIARAMDKAGVTLMCNTTVSELHYAADCVTGVTLNTGVERATDMVVFATGVRPNTAFLADTGIAMDGRKRICVNEFMQTTMQDIYAAGDCVVVPHQLTGELVPSTTWPDAMHQGRIAAHAMTGDLKPYPGIVPIISSAFFGLKFCSTMHGRSYVVSTNTTETSYTRLYMHKNRLHGFEQVGESLDITQLRRQLLTRELFS